MVVGKLEPILAEVRGRYTLDRLSLNHRANIVSDRQQFTLIFTPKNNLESPVNLTSIFLVGRRREPRQATLRVLKVTSCNIVMLLLLLIITAG